MGQFDNVSNETHWKNLCEKAKRGGWNDTHKFFDPVFITTQGIGHKGLYRRIFQVPFLIALYGDEEVETGLYDSDLMPCTLPRYWHISSVVHDMLMQQNNESVLAYMDSVPTNDDRLRPDTKKKEAAT